MNRLEKLRTLKPTMDANNNFFVIVDEVDYNWIIQQAEAFNKIKESWIDIETNGNRIDASDFYTVVQDILHDHETEGESR